jgi:hypothetical protein
MDSDRARHLARFAVREAREWRSRPGGTIQDWRGHALVDDLWERDDEPVSTIRPDRRCSLAGSDLSLF